MKHRNLFRLILILTAAIEVNLLPTRNFELDDMDDICNVNLGHKTIWQNVGIRGFYGPWNIATKQNGDYVDYNDYGVRVEQFRPNSLELPHDVSITNGYIDELPSVYGSGLPEFNTLFSSVGLADFRIGVRTGDWIDRNTDGTTARYWEDIASQKTGEDKEEPEEESVIPKAARH